MKEATRVFWLERFGVRIFEGYGATETAPVIAMNTPFVGRNGTTGRLMPGLEHRLEPMPGIDRARLLVRGPNVMKGYLRAENPGVIEAPEGGWYDTGDAVEIDAAGFVTIKGRIKRFAKVGARWCRWRRSRAGLARLARHAAGRHRGPGCAQGQSRGAGARAA